MEHNYGQAQGACLKLYSLHRYKLGNRLDFCNVNHSSKINESTNKFKQQQNTSIKLKARCFWLMIREREIHLLFISLLSLAHTSGFPYPGRIIFILDVALIDVISADMCLML